MSFGPKRILLALTNVDTVDVVAWGGNKLTFANGFPLAPGEPGAMIGFEGEEAQASLYVIADAGKTANYHLSWIEDV
jgi:hypothetical protein